MAIFRILFALAFLLNFIIVGVYRRRTQSRGEFRFEEERRLDGILLRLSALAFWGYSLVYVLAPGLLEWSTFNLATTIRLLGALIALTFVPLATRWAQATLGVNITPTVQTRAEHSLVTDGPYAYVRHPLYTIGQIFYVSLALLAASWFLLAISVVSYALIVLRTQREEIHLEQRFGVDYQSYRAQTGRFLPRWRTGREDS